MNQENIINSKNVKTIVIITIVMMLLSLAISAVQTPKYQSSAKLLIVINQGEIDPYTASRSSDYVAGILSEVIYSHSFIDVVLKTNFELKDELGFNREKRLNNWEKMIKTKTKENRGIIYINVIHPDKNQANQYAQAISYVLITNHDQYHGLKDKVTIKMIDSPTISENKVQPKILFNTLLGLIVGLIVSFTFVIVFPEQELIAVATFRNRPNKKDETIELVATQDQNPEEFNDQFSNTQTPEQNQDEGFFFNGQDNYESSDPNDQTGENQNW